jgi:hypothetical protein
MSFDQQIFSSKIDFIVVFDRMFRMFLLKFWFRKHYSTAGVGKKGRVKSNPHSKIHPIMSGH